jgi:4-hydroxyphenylpyruvate dioxygenase
MGLHVRDLPDVPTASENPAENPAGTDGFAFVEFASSDQNALRALFRRMGFGRVARHKTRAIELYRQGDITFVLNADADSFGGRFAVRHGPSAPSMAWHVGDTERAFTHAVSRGATPYSADMGAKSLDVPAIVGIGGSLLYFVEHPGSKGSAFADDYQWLAEADPDPIGVGLQTIDHLTNNVHRGNMDQWYAFYHDLFGFRQIRTFDISGKKTGLVSRALTSPCGKIRIPLNESTDDQSQIEEYLRDYRGEGIQHVALGCKDIYTVVGTLAWRGMDFMPAPPATYYEQIEARLPGHGEPLEKLAARGLLIDGSVASGTGPKLLLQIFSKTLIGPIFFEFIERKGDDGFGEGNFRALFESIEADQIRRGVLRA